MTPSGVTAAVENFGQRRVFLERFRTASLFVRVFVFRDAFSVDFGALLCRGVPPELSRGHHSEPRRCQVCPGAFFHRFSKDFGVHLRKHFRTCCIVLSIHFRSVFRRRPDTHL